MEQYIPKAAVVAKIKRLQDAHKDQLFRNLFTMDFIGGIESACDQILSYINTLEVKEVDLEDSIKETLAQKYIDYTFKRYNIDPDSKEGQLICYAYMHGMNQCLNQLKAQKGE